MEGRVYEWGNATPSDKSFVVIDNFQTLIPAKLIPLKDANIKIEPWEPKERPDISNPSLWSFETQSNEHGYFNTGGTIDPGADRSTISVDLKGYDSVEHVFNHGNFKHIAIIVLVRKSDGKDQKELQNKASQRTTESLTSQATQAARNKKFFFF
jgi:hypothetical protein